MKDCFPLSLQQRFSLLLALFAFFLIAAGTEPLPDSLVRRGNEAFARGDYAEALSLYQRAAERASDPGLTAFNQAMARYQLARLDPTGDFAGLREAAELFRCCTALDDPRRPEALFGLANCLLFGPPGPQGENYRQALAAYDKSLQIAPDSHVAASAKLNRARARLLADQYLPSPDSEDKGEDPDQAPRQRPEKKAEQGPTKEGSKPEGSDQTETSTEKGNGAKGEGPQAAAAGKIRPIPKKEQESPLTSSEAEAHLRLAVPQILKDLRDNRLSGLRPVPEGVRDW